MYLKSLDLVGFKSFVNKTHLEFHEGITSVVGPNGCGKSNILDSIRWCLGEQSAKALRGGEMSDVIFSGTDTRSAVGMAEVSLTFGGCAEHLGTEWDEVCVTRRIFRDGKGEYLLNKTPCRLRDIHELFMDTGIGRSSYSIMEQGKIDLILSSRPEDRRTVFEEAAGITKFKAQKKEALRKLEYTEANLVRVSDIMREVKRQIGSLQRQAGKARRYQSLVGDLRVLELNFVKKRHDELKVSHEELQETLEKMETRWQGMSEALESGEQALAEKRGRLVELEAQVEGARQYMQVVRDKMVQAKSRVSHNEETTTQLRETISRCEQEIAAALERQRVQREEVARTEEQIKQVGSELAERAGALDALQAKLRETAGRRETSRQSLEVLRTEISRAENEAMRLQGELVGLDGRRESMRGRLDALGEESRQLFDRKTEARRRLEETESQLTMGGEALRAVESELDGAEAALERGELERQRIETEISTTQRTLAQLQSRLEVLEQLNLEGEGASPGAQAVLRGLKRPDHFKPLVRGMLGSLLRVEPGFLEAVEAALAAQAETIVLNHKGTEREILQELYESKLGRASLVIPGSEFVAEAAKAPEGGLGWVADRVHCDGDESLQKLVRGLLRGVALATNLDHAYELRQHNPGVAFATQHGELIDAMGVVTGGRAGEGTSSALQRRDEIAALGEKRIGLQAELTRHEQVREEVLSARTKHKEALEAARVLLRQRQTELAVMRANHGQLQREVADAENRGVALERENERALKELGDAERRAGELKQIIEERRRQAEEATTRTAKLMEEAEQAANEEKATSAEFNELRIQLASARQREESLLSQRSPMLSRIQELEETVRQRGVEKASAENRIHTLGEQSNDLNEQATASQSELTEKQAGLDALQQERSSLQLAVQTADEGLRQTRREHSTIQDQKSRIEVQAAELRLKAENLQEDIRRRHHVEISEVAMDSYALHCAVRDHRKRRKNGANAAELSTGEGAENETSDGEGGEGKENVEGSNEEPQTVEAQLDWMEVELFVSELREKIDSMGPVNIDAIQEFDELLDRQKFLDEQFADLTGSKDELLEVIKKINSTTTTLFAETFEKIRMNFRSTFKELFGGGKADLELTDNGDPLESGIDITAKPPGKQPQSVSLLSGGERTMTAVALLFAIYMVKPSPFCILDEMDAPLDESNINRFLAMLDRFVQQSQFLVITHNKRTISRADVLYGVTMEEQGVSKLVSVKFVDSRNNTTTAQAPEMATAAGEAKEAEASEEAKPVEA